MSNEPDPRTDIPSFTAALRDRQGALFLDFDGTLAPLVDRPGEARALPQAVRAVDRLRPFMPITLVTGRSLADIVHLAAESGLDPDRLAIAGSHGYEVQGAGLRQPPVADEATRALLQSALPRLRERLADCPGAIIEPKAFAIAIHWRLAERDTVPMIEAVVDDLVREAPGLKKTHGKMVFELRPALDWHKGKAVDWIMRQWQGKASLPIFIGDDVTDIDGLEAVRDGGIGIAVGNTIPAGHARYRLADPEAVAQFLDALAASIASKISHT